MPDDPIGDDDTLVFLPFTETSGATAADLAGGRDAALRGDAVLGADGRSGAGLGLPGAGYAEIAHDAAFDLASGALSFWVQPETTGTLQGLVSKDASGFGAGQLSVLLRADGRVSFVMQSETRTFQAISDRALTPGDWAHVEVRWGEDGMRLLLDGALDGASAWTGGLAGNDLPWTLGANAGKSAPGGAPRDFLHGVLDEFALRGPAAAPPPPPPDPEPAAAALLSFAGQTGRAKTVDLTRGFWADAPRVMPLGDSITEGDSNVIPDPLHEGYRVGLWSKITSSGGWIDYVGGEASGPATLQDRDHQGVGGIKATTVVGLAEGHATAHRPDVVLLMLGTNDLKFEPNAASTVPGELLSIMRSIASVEPGVTVLLAPSPPIDPSVPGFKYLANADVIRDKVNAKLPGIVAQAQADGIDARLISVPGLSKGDLYDGVHPTAGGYAKLAAAWFAALEDGLASGEFGGRRTATAGVRDVTGSDVGDHLRGDDASNRIFGRKGADRIEGDGGADILTGGAGTDVFVWRTAADGGDRITDFRQIDFFEVFASGFGGGLSAGGSVILRSALAPVAQGGAGQFLYDRDDGRLTWDHDGTGADAEVLIARLDDVPSLGADDFLIT